jgi:hypothetical protein
MLAIVTEDQEIVDLGVPRSSRGGCTIKIKHLALYVYPGKGSG